MNGPDERWRTKPQSHWVTQDGKEVRSFAQHFANQTSPSLSLYWFVDPASRWPVKLQLVGLWILRHVFRRLP